MWNNDSSQPASLTEAQHLRQDEELASFAERRQTELDWDELDSQGTFAPSQRWIKTRRQTHGDRNPNK